MRHDRAPSPETGFTIVEVIAAMIVLLVGVLGVVALVDGANRTTSSNRAREGATNLTREMIEDARSVPYGSLNADTLVPTIASLSGGTAQAGGTIVYALRGVTYTTTPIVCYVDDPKDGYGNHAGASYCNSESGTSDSFPSDYKRFTVVTTWSGARGSGTSRQSAVINDPGSSIAPQIAAFSMTAPTTCDGNPSCQQIDSGVNPTASFSVTTSVRAAKVTWYVNDTKMGTAAGSATGPWTFTWPLSSLATGTYTVSVRANSGKDGPVRSLAVPVKQTSIGPPTNPYGGNNQLYANVVELNWTPIPSGVLGYEVERLVAGTWSQVPCYNATGTVAASPRPTGSYCLDKAAGGATQYRVYSVYSRNGTPTRSSTAAIVTIDGANVRPCRPTGSALAGRP